MQIVRFIDNPLSGHTESITTDDIHGEIKKRYKAKPDNLRFYDGHVSKDRDVTPKNSLEIKALENIEEVWVVNHAADPIQLVVAAISLVVSVVSSLFSSRPTAQQTTTTTNRETSPNNQLASRVNQARHGARVPDIVGTVYSIPDLIAPTYSIFENHRQVEFAYMCVGRGFYDINPNNILEDTTPITQIDGSCVEIYGPNTSPSSGAPELVVGGTIDEPPRTAKRIASVTGQTLLPSDHFEVSDTPLFGLFPDRIARGDANAVDFDEIYEEGDVISITGADSLTAIETTPTTFVDVSVRPQLNGELQFETMDVSSFLSQQDEGGFGSTIQVIGLTGIPSGIDYSGTYIISQRTNSQLFLIEQNGIANAWDSADPTFTTATIIIDRTSSTVNLNGTFTVNEVSDGGVGFDRPDLINPDWAVVANPNVEILRSENITLRAVDKEWVGPFIVDGTESPTFVSNFIAENGLFGDNGERQISISVAIEIETTPVNSSGVALGASTTETNVISGSIISRDLRARTTSTSNSTGSDFVSIRVRRATPLFDQSGVQYAQSVSWRDLFVTRITDLSKLGDVTTAWVKTVANASSVGVGERRFNLEVTRKLPVREEGSEFTSELFPTRRFADILSWMCLDPLIGNLTVDNVDFDNIYSVEQQILEYFGTQQAVEFSYTFDDSNISFEESVNSISAAVFCEAFRFGRKIRLSPELSTSDATLLFNHRNILPGTQEVTTAFGNLTEYDGVEINYSSEDDGETLTLSLPEDQQILTPLQIETIGLRGRLMAYFHAWRALNKIKYEHTTISFQATEEARLLVRGDRIFATDQTKHSLGEGEVVSQSGLTLELSQPVDFMVDGQDYWVFLQHSDQSIETIQCVKGSEPYTIVLQSTPSGSIVVDQNAAVRTVFFIADDSAATNREYFITETNGDDPFRLNVSASNFDPRFYERDSDFINGLVDADAN